MFCKRKEVPIIEKKAYIGRIRWWIYEWFKVKRRSIYAQKMIDKIVQKANGISMNFMLTSYVTLILRKKHKNKHVYLRSFRNLGIERSVVESTRGVFEWIQIGR